MIDLLMPGLPVLILFIHAILLIGAGDFAGGLDAAS
jgi:hypothetical protein